MTENLDLCFEIENHLIGQRVDKALSGLAPADYSRERIKQLISTGHVWFDGEAVKSPSQKIAKTGIIVMQVPEPENATPVAEDIPLDVLYEDDDLLVINKPVGLVVHPGAGNDDGTMVNALLHHCGDSLSGIGGVKRPGIVHRLDKDTSGLIMVAKNDFAHKGLSDQLADRSLSRVYHALCWGVPTLIQGKVDAPVGRDAQNRVRMAVTSHVKGREALTYYKAIETFGDGEETLSLMECRLQTGRTHQIRVHMQHIGFPLVGDNLYGAQKTKQISLLNRGGYKEDELQDLVLNFPRQALHAGEIRFIHPRSEEEMRFIAPYPDDFRALLNRLRRTDDVGVV